MLKLTVSCHCADVFIMRNLEMGREKIRTTTLCLYGLTADSFVRGAEVVDRSVSMLAMDDDEF